MKKIFIDVRPDFIDENEKKAKFSTDLGIYKDHSTSFLLEIFIVLNR